MIFKTYSCVISGVGLGDYGRAADNMVLLVGPASRMRDTRSRVSLVSTPTALGWRMLRRLQRVYCQNKRGGSSGVCVCVCGVVVVVMLERI